MNTRITSLAVLSSCLIMGTAFAADLPNRKEPPVYTPPPAFSWTGWHFGVNGGYAGGTVQSNETIYAFPFAGFPGFAGTLQASAGTSGFIVGGQTGYMWQLPNNIVVGYESDIQYSDVRSRRSYGFTIGDVNNRLEWFGTERLRFGYAFGRFLPYVTGGLSYGKVSAHGTELVGGFVFPVSASTTHAGWTVGGGLEYAFTDSLSFKAEYLYVELEGVRGVGLGVPTVAGFPAAYRSFSTGPFATHIGRAGLNWKFPSIGYIFGIEGL
jgi:outer membrane immunogenic protein